MAKVQTFVTTNGGTIFVPSGDDRYCDMCARNIGQDRLVFKEAVGQSGYYKGDRFNAAYYCIRCAQNEGYIKAG
jgi:hypothetical protein